MAGINFLPVCSNCRAILDDHEITIENGMNLAPPIVKMITPWVSPTHCPHCGAAFDRITMPSGLPVPPSRSFTGV